MASLTKNNANLGIGNSDFNVTKYSIKMVSIFVGNIIISRHLMENYAEAYSSIFHHPTRSDVNSCPIPVSPLGCAIHAKIMYCITQGHTQKVISFVYTPYVYWKMRVYHNITPEFSLRILLGFQKTFSRNGENTMEPKSKANILIGQREGLSPGDKLQARLLYGCPSECYSHILF